MTSPRVYWQPIRTAPEGVPVMTKIDDAQGVRNEQVLMRNGNTWFTRDGRIYVNYTPTHWKEA